MSVDKLDSGTKRISKDSRNFYKFYMLNPKENSDIDALAEGLIAFKEVEEVYVTDGAHGFLVKTRFSEGKEPKNVCDYITRKIDSKFGQVTAYFSYKK